MKNLMLLAGALLTIGMLLLFVGCTGPSESNDQGQGAQNGVQQPAGGDQPSGDQGAGQETQQPPQDNGQQPGDQAGAPGQQSRRPGGWGNLGVEACNGKAEGDACQLTMRNQTVDGKCTNRNGNITCFPNNASMGQRPNGAGGMGEQLVQACNGKAVGDACQLTMRNQTVDGTCADRQGNITCTPNNRNAGQRPGGPGGNPGAQAT